MPKAAKHPCCDCQNLRKAKMDVIVEKRSKRGEQSRSTKKKGKRKKERKRYEPSARRPRKSNTTVCLS